jgi:hypothetical protein
MDARKNGDENPFDNTLYCLEWIASAMDAARRHKEQHGDVREPRDVAGFPSRPRAVPDSSPDSAPGSYPDSASDLSE